MKRQWILQGRLVSGTSTAARFTQLDWVRQQWRDKLDFTPFPGTLNLEIDPDFLPLVSELRGADAIELNPQAGDGCAAKVIPLSIEGIRGAIIIPEDKVNIHGQNIVEVLAPVGLRKALGLEDGQLLTLFADRPGNDPLDAVIFDLDGTLLDSVGIYFEIVRTVLDRFGFPQVSMDVIREAAKDSGFEWARVLPESTLVKQPGLRAQILSVVEEVYRPLFEIQAEPMPGMRSVVENLVAAGIKLGIVTSTPGEHVGFKLKKLKQNDTLGYFGAIVTTSDVARKKPAPDPMMECCRQLDVKLENSVYIGDSRSDIQSGRIAGMKTIAVLSGFDDLRALSREFPDAVINSVADLGTLFD